MDTLAAIDRALANLCPCGGDPRGPSEELPHGSPYCSYDCEPTHVSIHTDQRETGEYATPMRWRPDLVTAVDNGDLTLLSSETFYTGRFHAQLFQRGELVRGAIVWHLRLDDGYRFVGVDMDTTGTPAELSDRIDARWAALERELGNSRHVDVDPWADVMRDVGERIDQRIDAVFTVTAPTAWSDTASDPLEDWRAFMRTWPERAAGHYRPELLHIPSAFVPGHIWTTDRQHVETAEPGHPMLAAIERRRNRNTGPEQRQRAPRQINPRRR
jgi:hypothetical protein